MTVPLLLTLAGCVSCFAGGLSIGLAKYRRLQDRYDLLYRSRARMRDQLTRQPYLLPPWESTWGEE